ncbi:MAG TPA: plastocyanin/azurin family copper-binding protein [Methylomirabilota bacterium]|nr:plastocyanin/azurin family copper-binding protein [Methylomirabilota bacterium]
MKRLWRIVAALVVVGLVWLEPVVSRAQSGSVVTIQVFQFQPNPLEVKAGAQVTWTNQDDIEHTVTSGTPERPDGRFNSVLAGKGKTASFTFKEAGMYSYFCNRHQSMRGQINVK